MQILAVDDDVITLEILRNLLEEAGDQVLIAQNGREAMQILRNNANCQLVISDWEMPKMDGIELCTTIRGNELGRYVYIILLTCREGTSNVVEGLSAGADDFISKPFEPQELLVRLRVGKRVLSLETRKVTIFALAKLAESRDPETGAHLERVREYSRILAEKLAEDQKFSHQIDTGFIWLIYESSPLHDIGKVAIPDHVLLKPGQLDAAEWQIMRSHTVEGAETLESALLQFPEAEFLQMARDIALTHHERIDGTGYPEGLVGDDIPLCSRIFAIADAYDAIVCKRVYKKAYNHEIARHLILGAEGTQFDPEVVQAFLRCESKFQEIKDKFAQVPLMTI